MTNILFVHNNFPAQFGFVAEAAVTQGHRCAAIASPTGRAMPGVPVEKWLANRASSREILEVLHFVGADDRFIAREFQLRFLGLGLKGGAIGCLAAILLIAALGFLTGYWRASPGGDQIEALFGAFDIGWRGYGAVIVVTAIVAAVTALVSRFTVRRHLSGLG